MSWPQWPATQPPVSAVPPVLNAAAPVINSAPAVVPPGMQYTPEQWAQLQQQNWHQWAQWQQQYQQWHQQYGAEYQKSMNALAQAAQQQATPLPNVAVPPPLPVETKPPLPPAEEPPPPQPPQTYNTQAAQSYNSVAQAGYNTVPAPLPNLNERPPIPYSKPPQNYYSQTQYPSQNKRSFDQAPISDAKRKQPWPPTQTQPRPPPNNTDELSEAEKKFDKQFGEWEAQFQKWKEQNAEHPDKEQYKEYEKKWESWRAQLLERREQMRRKRLGLALNSPKSVNSPLPNFSQAPPKLAPKPSGVIFTKPPPNMNDEPLHFKGDAPQEDFIKPNIGGGIPGLDLVKEEAAKEKKETEEVVVIDGGGALKKGPDFDAISKGINTILGDQKLLTMLNLVSQNQNIKVCDNVTNSISKIRDGSNQDFNSQMSNQSFEEPEIPPQKEFVNNFDDQTRSSFTTGYNDQYSEPSFARNQTQNLFPNRFGAFNQGGRFGGDNNTFRNNFVKSEDRFGSNQQRERFAQNQDERFGSGSNQSDRFAQDRFGSNQNQKFGLPSNQGNRFGSLSSPGEKIGSGGAPERFGFKPNQPSRFGFETNHDERFGSEHDRFAPNGNRLGANRERFGPNHQERFQQEEYNYDENYDNYNYDQDSNYYEDVNPKSEGPAPPVEEVKKPDIPIFEPASVIDYEHKSLKSVEPEILVEPIYMFDYRHKPLSRIPLPQRPKWLSDEVRNIREFDMPLVRPYETPNSQIWREKRGREDDWSGRHSRRTSYEDRRYYNERYEELSRREERRFHNNDDKKEKPRPFQSLDLNEEKISDTEWPEDEEFYNSSPGVGDTFPKFTKNEPVKKSAVLIEDLISPPGRFNRAPRIVIILRGPPGSGKTFLAKLIKDKEVENGGSTPRILSLDDYFMVEQEKEVTEEGKKIKIKEMVYEYEAEMEESYRSSLVKSFKKTITDGYFSFIIVDNVNDKVKYFGEMWSFAKQNGFQVYICQLDLDVQTCSKRNIHGRSESDIEKCVKEWEPTPAHHPTLDATSLFQAASIPEVEMEEVNSPESETNDAEGSEDQVARSKWDNFDCSVDNLAKLDGVSKPLRGSRTMEEYLRLDEEWTPSKPSKPGQKRVRWADLEEQKHQEKMRAIGFVVGHTNWNRMMDPTNGGSALTQTKYIERTGRGQK